MLGIKNGDGNVWKGLTAGIVGGLVGGLVMDGFQALWTSLTGDEKDSELAHSPKQSGRESEGLQGSEDLREREPSDGIDAPATIKLASIISEDVLGHELREDEKEAAGMAVHYGFSVITGGVYGVIAELAPRAKIGEGTAFGAAVWIAADELTLPLVGLSKGPTAYPISKHAYSLASHIVYGAATEAARRAVRGIL
jgi:uncharacterized membrane protein YagU involved in acid resistance